MYVIISPCVYDQSLRAEGITSHADCDIFSHCQERCHTFHIQTFQYRCPETSYFGMQRQPSSFEGMNTPGFSHLLDEIETEIREYISRHGKPAAIIGVDSSPICGICYTYKTSLKEPGRGELVARFADIRGIDVKTFARYRTLLISHKDEPVQPIVEHLTAGKLLVTKYEVPGALPLESAYDLCILTDPCFFCFGEMYCDGEYIRDMTTSQDLESFISSYALMKL